MKGPIRFLRRSPAFSTVVIATLALGIGATVTVFSIVDAWLLKPLAFPQADRIVVGLAATRERPLEPAIFMLYRTYLAWRDRSRSFDVVSAAFRRSFLIAGRGDATTAMGMAVTGEFFRTLAVPAVLGRTLTEADITGPAAVVLSHGLWLRQFGGSNAVIGSQMTLNGVPHEVVGVMPREFDVRMLDQVRGYELWTTLKEGEPGYEPGGAGPVAIVGRLRSGVSIAAAQAELEAIQRDVESKYKDSLSKFVVLLTSLKDDNTRLVRSTLLTVAGAVGSLLLIACTNVGTLLLGRGLGRAREAAIRAAIGSNRGRLLRQFLGESLLLSAIGGICGLALAMLATRLFVIWNPLAMLPAVNVRIDWRALAFAVIATGLTVVVSGLWPAMRVASTDPIEALRSGGDRGPTGASTQRAQALMLTAQMAVSVLLLIATALLARTFMRLQESPLGFEPSNLTIVSVAVPLDEFESGEKRNVFYAQLAEKVRGLPGVDGVAAGSSPPLFSGALVSVRTTEDDTDAPLRLSAQDVTLEFFRTLRIPLVAGRAFDARDSVDSPAVAVINDKAATVLFGSPAAALGRRIRIGARQWREVIGVVGNTRSVFFNTLEWLTNPVIYSPAPQAFDTIRDPTVRSFGLHVHIRTARSPSMAELKSVVASLNSRVAVTEVTTAAEAVAQATKQPALRMALLGWFAFASLLLAAIGVYGLVSQNVVQRMREIGIRVALGADANHVVRTVVRHAIVAGIIGCGFGLLAAMGLVRSLESLLYGVRATDATSFASAAMILMAVTVIAALIPALRATRIDPVEVLRGE